ncbi:myb-like protein X, partial [Ruditapes philippinarum]|uniref:myb-like protein X n=1 Tax=Ruditapes philippinarum TaxID=129788 RepID=UPI00295BA0BA
MSYRKYPSGEEIKYECRLCDRDYPRRANIIRHILERHFGACFICLGCGKQFSRENAPHTCKDANKVRFEAYNKITKLKGREAENAATKYKCTEIEKDFRIRKTHKCKFIPERTPQLEGIKSIVLKRKLQNEETRPWKIPKIQSLPKTTSNQTSTSTKLFDDLKLSDDEIELTDIEVQPIEIIEPTEQKTDENKHEKTNNNTENENKQVKPKEDKSYNKANTDKKSEENNTKQTKENEQTTSNRNIITENKHKDIVNTDNHETDKKSEESNTKTNKNNEKENKEKETTKEKCYNKTKMDKNSDQTNINKNHKQGNKEDKPNHKLTEKNQTMTNKTSEKKTSHEVKGKELNKNNEQNKEKQTVRKSIEDKCMTIDKHTEKQKEKQMEHNAKTTNMNTHKHKQKQDEKETTKTKSKKTENNKENNENVHQRNKQKDNFSIIRKSKPQKEQITNTNFEGDILKEVIDNQFKTSDTRIVISDYQTTPIPSDCESEEEDRDDPFQMESNYEKLQLIQRQQEEFIQLNIGRTIFYTSKITLLNSPYSILHQMTQENSPVNILRVVEKRKLKTRPMIDFLISDTTKKIFNGTTKSELHDKFLTGTIRERAKMKHRGFGLIDDDEQIEFLLSTYLTWIKQINKNIHLDDVNYVFDVWVPE